MQNNTPYSMLLPLALISSLTACAHASRIDSVPPGAEVYLDGEQVGVTPYTITDTLGTSNGYEIVLRKPGYKTHQAHLQQTEFALPLGLASIACGACTLGLGCLGLFWTWQLEDSYNFTLVPLSDDAAVSPPPTSQPASSAPAEAGELDSQGFVPL